MTGTVCFGVVAGRNYPFYEISLNLLDPDDVIQIMLSMCDLL